MTKYNSIDEARVYLSNASKSMKTIFRDFNRSPTEAFMIGQKVWGDIPPETITWGFDPASQSLGPENYHTEVLDVMAKAMAPLAAKHGDEIVEKASTTTSASYFIPVFIEPRLIDIVKRETPYLAIIPKKTLRGKTVNVPRRITGVTPEFKPDDASAISLPNQGYGDVNVDVRYMYAGGQVTYPTMATTKLTLNMKQENIQHTFLDFMRKKEEYLLRNRTTAGTESWGGYNGADANSYDGLFKRVHEDYSANENQLAGSAAIGIGDIDDSIETMFTNGGRTDFWISDLNTLKKLTKIGRTYQRIEKTDVQIGIPQMRMTIDGVPGFATTQLLPTANNRSLAMIDNRAHSLYQLQPDTYMEIAQDDTDSFRYIWKVYETPVYEAPEWLITVNGGA